MVDIANRIFETQALGRLAFQHEQTLRDLNSIEQALNSRFYEMQDAVLALILAVASGESLLLVGPPGTGKSRLIRDFCEYAGIDPRPTTREARDDGYFEYLLTPFTEPSELFGSYDIKTARETGQLKRLYDTGMMQHARVVYLDEVFNGSSAILNSLLAFMNEGVLHDRGDIVPVKVQCVFGATNNTPNSPELRAIFDRFLLRVFVRNADAQESEISGLLGAAWRETYARSAPQRTFPDLLERVQALQADIEQIARGGQLTPKARAPFYRRLAQFVHTARQYGYSQMSNRRLIKMLHVMLIHALLQATRAGDVTAITLGDAQLGLMRFAVDRWDDLFETQFDEFFA